jgi:hypothetical protein
VTLVRLRLIATVGALAALALGGGAGASPAARVDQLIRPDFRSLLSPPPKPAYRPVPLRRASHRPPHRPSRPAPVYARLESITVDCGDPYLGPTPLGDALYALADYGVLYIRARGGVCAETLEISRPVTIVGEAIPTFAPGPGPAPAKLAPQAGRPCIRVAPGVQGVEVRDLIIEASQAGRSACVESLDADLALVRVGISYAGDASAVFVSGGSLVVRDSSIAARTNNAAVMVDAAMVDFDRVRVTADVRGLDLAPRLGQSRLVQVGVIAEGATAPGSTGVTVRDLRSGGGQLLIANSVISGWASGVYADRGARVDIARTRILHALRGVTAASARVSLRESAIWADDYGGYFDGGEPTVEFNRFIGAVNGLTIERGAAVRVQPNYVYSPRLCPPMDPREAAVSYCLPLYAAPAAIADETGFDATGRNGWEQDGYDRGYLRDGPPRALPPPPPDDARRPRRGR